MTVDPDEKGNATVADRIVIRLARSDDLPAFVEITNWATAHTAANFRTEPDTLEVWRDLFNAKNERYPWLVAGRRGSVVGYAMASPFGDRCGLTYTAEVSVYVHPDDHGKGVGRALYHELIPMLTATGFRTLVAAIAIPNPASDRLHAALGFQKVGVLSRVGWKLGRWHDVAYWQRMLTEDTGAPDPVPACDGQRSRCGS